VPLPLRPAGTHPHLIRQSHPPHPQCAPPHGHRRTGHHQPTRASTHNQWRDAYHTPMLRSNVPQGCVPCFSTSSSCTSASQPADRLLSHPLVSPCHIAPAMLCSHTSCPSRLYHTASAHASFIGAARPPWLETLLTSSPLPADAAGIQKIVLLALQSPQDPNQVREAAPVRGAAPECHLVCCALADQCEGLIQSALCPIAQRILLSAHLSGPLINR
jgi:hypothetical protein